MRTYLRGKISLLFLTIAVLLAVPAVAALADNLQDTVTGGSPSKTIATGTANAWTNDYWVQATGSGPAGCDIGTAPAKFKLNVPPEVTADTTDLSFAACGTSTTNTVPVKFSSNTPGVYNISATYVSGGTAGDTFNEGPADLTLTVVGVNSVTPADGATGVAVNSDATATFSQNVTGVSASTFKLVKDGTTAALPAAVSYNSTTKTATLNPTSDLLPSTKYNATISGVQFDGVTLEAKTWSFTTAAPPPPSCTNPADPTFSGTPDGSNGWYKSIPAVSASSTAGATVQYSLNAAGPFSNTAPTLGQGETTVYAKAVSGTCSSGVSSRLYKVDTIAPSINDDGTTQTPNGANWFNTAVSNGFSASDATSGLPASFTNPFSVSSGTDEGSAVNINSGPVSDNAGNTNPGIDSAAFQIDLTKPTITGSRNPAANANGWNNGPVTVGYTCADNLSGVASCGSADLLDTEGANQSATGSATDAAGNTADATVSGINIDLTKPTISATAERLDGTTVLGDYTAGNWTNKSVRVSFSCADTLSGTDTNTVAGATKSASGADQSVTNTGTCTDKAGNTAESKTFNDIDIDKDAPTGVTFQGGGLSDNASYDFGSVPDGPTGCTATDTLSGFKSCGTDAATTYKTTVGTHIITATAEDNAGNKATKTLTYTVKPYNLNGFYQPVDMGNDVLNTVKNGSTVPMKFEIFQSISGTELTSTSGVSLTAKPVNCTAFNGDTEDPIEMVTTGGTSLRYDSTGGQFIYNWQTPKKPNTCYNVTMTAADGSTLTAYFKLK